MALMYCLLSTLFSMKSPKSVLDLGYLHGYFFDCHPICIDFSTPQNLNLIPLRRDFFDFQSKLNCSIQEAFPV